MGQVVGSIGLTRRIGLGSVVKALLKEPVLLIEAVRAFFSVRRRSGVFVSSVYLDWRIATAYGTSKTTMPTEDLVHYLRWRRRMRGLQRWEQAT